MKYKKDTKCKYENTASEEHSLAIAKQLSIQLWNPNPSAKNTKYKNIEIRKYKRQRQIVRTHPSPWHSSRLLTIAALHCLPSNRIRLRWGNTHTHVCVMQTYTDVLHNVCAVKCNTLSLWLGRLHAATLPSGIVCLRLTFLLNETPYRLKLTDKMQFCYLLQMPEHEDLWSHCSHSRYLMLKGNLRQI